ncbi:hypothetical protein ACFY2N_34150 [Streptomyces rubiginosohelvolus]|uniref:hypothetical protein n=1 Tax=Streptomyces rubiginosohelvolus TaxID=67362 RepID=UPI0036B24901
MLAAHELDILSVLERYAEGVGMEGVAGRSRANHRRTALLWRRGCIRRRSTNDYSCVAHRTFAQHRLYIDGIGDVAVMSVHAHRANGEVHYSEAQQMPSLTAGTGRAALVGDFSSVHGRPLGGQSALLAEPDLEPDIALAPDYMLASEALFDAAGGPVLDDEGRPVFDRLPSKALQIGGFIDVAAELVPPPERLQTGAFLRADAPRRLDRVYTYGLPLGHVRDHRGLECRNVRPLPGHRHRAVTHSSVISRQSKEH